MKRRTIIVVSVSLFIVAAMCVFVSMNMTSIISLNGNPASQAATPIPESVATSVSPAPPPSNENDPITADAFVAPLARADERTTKKPFGIYITKANSPVQPERFSGYHTGTDFETFLEEASVDVSVSAICSGKLLSKRTASGYGGIVVQSCVYDGQPVTVIYGHLRLSSVQPGVGETLQPGDYIGYLGTGYSTETDGERKHLHLGIHKGSVLNILGYVQSKEGLSGWIDACPLVCKSGN
jgi:murein DD-endopeptidase MepM/ murein hydrolase activator NlpD